MQYIQAILKPRRHAVPKKKERPKLGRPLSKKSKLADLRGKETRAQLSQRSGVAYRTLTRYETGGSKPKGLNAEKLATALNVTVEELA